MVVERKLKFAPSVAFDPQGRRVALPGGIAFVASSPLMSAEAVLFETPDELEVKLAPGEVGRLIQSGQASAVPLH